jgi:hypothetical protein
MNASPTLSECSGVFSHLGHIGLLIYIYDYRNNVKELFNRQHSKQVYPIAKLPHSVLVTNSHLLQKYQCSYFVICESFQ